MPRRWLIGVEPAASNSGALTLGSWLHEHTQGRHELHGAHAFTELSVGLANRPGTGPDTAALETIVRDFLAQHEVADAMLGVDFRVGAPERVLPAIMDEGNHVALVVGRRSPTGPFSMSSLGQVGRRLLHRLHWPLVVAPAHPRPQSLGHGPLVVAVHPSDSCLGAVRFARWLGQELSLPVVLAHAIPRRNLAAAFGALDLAPRDPTMGAPDIVEPEDTMEIEVALESWLEEHELQGLPLAVRRGPVVAALREVGRETMATMLICGTRKTSLVDRLQAANVGSDLAAQADRPVAVIPSEARP